MTELANRTRMIADRIETIEASGLNAVTSLDQRALAEQARRLDELPHDIPLRGLAVGVKDNICTLDYPTTCASRMLEGYRSPYEATAVARLKKVGAFIACKTNLDEFAMGSSTEHSVFGRTRHPLDPDRVPGGSSGGSVALVATGGVDAALGSETGGSVRQPAAFCGVVGLKPTYGRVSRYGLVAFGSSLDQIGVVAPTVDVAGRILATISGQDDHDATCANRPPLELRAPPDDLRDVTIGVPREYFPPDLQQGVETVCRWGIDRLRDAGATIRHVSLPHTGLAIPAYYVIAPAEASSNLARYDGVRYGLRVAPERGNADTMYRTTRASGFGSEVRRRILLGTYVLSAGYYEAYYGRAVATRARIAQDFQELFDSGVDLLFAPTTPTTAFQAGQKLDDPVSMYLSDAFVCPANLAGLPAVSVPLARAGGLPVGGQLIAPLFAEAEMLAVAAVLERLMEPERNLA